MALSKKEKVYVAGGWKFRKEIQNIIDELKEIDYIQIVSGWIERENGDTSPDSLMNDAYLDCKEIEDCDILLAIMTDPEYAYRGTFTEIGYALALRKTVIVLCDGERKKDGSYTHYCMTNVFFWHPYVSRIDNLIETKNFIAVIAYC